MREEKKERMRKKKVKGMLLPLVCVCVCARARAQFHRQQHATYKRHMRSKSQKQLHTTSETHALQPAARPLLFSSAYFSTCEAFKASCTSSLGRIA
jgi:hypothetical protein